MASMESCVQDVPSQPVVDRIRLLYPNVDESETPLPRQWSQRDKFNYLGLSQNNLRVHYKGSGKNHKDAASVRTVRPIPASCGIYYFEVKIVSKGRDGYMGIGLSASNVNLNRLPGWDKNSFGYHGDDGNSFCSSGTGQPYGPTFTTGDVVGCCINLIDMTCFYTKNGVYLGIAFRDLPHQLHPTVGLQTPGEVVEANFGQSPFVFHIEDYIEEWRMKTQASVSNFPVSNKYGEFHSTLNRLVSRYLTHHGYCSTAESFIRCTGDTFEEELASIRNRQKIQKLILAGRLGEAIEVTEQLFPGLLERNGNLLFMLKCRQFIEIVNGTDTTCISDPASRSSSVTGGNGSRSRSGSSARSSPCTSPIHCRGSPALHRAAGGARITSPSRRTLGKTDRQSSPISKISVADEGMNGSNGVTDVTVAHFVPHIVRADDGNEMDTMEVMVQTSHKLATNGFSTNGDHDQDLSEIDEDADMEICEPQRHITCHTPQSVTTASTLSGRPFDARTASAVERLLKFGRELHALSIRLKQEYGKNEINKKALRDAFSLLAYSDPANSPVGYQLSPLQREPVCTALNSAILEMHGLPKQPPLELAVAHANQCLKAMSKAGIGSCAFVDVDSYLR